MNQRSEIDELFFRLMGYYPKKAGEAYEIISAAALGIIRDQSAEHNKYLQGLSGGRPYQLDGLLNGETMVESKDYTIDDRKVGRPDLQKLQGALTDLPQIKDGIFTSATEYSRDALKYAQGTETNEAQKEITAVDVRPSTPDDEKGRVMKIHVTMNFSAPDFDRGKTSFIYADGAKKLIEDYMRSHGMTEYMFGTDVLYDESGKFLKTIADLSRENQPKFTDDDDYVSGEFPIDAYIKFCEILVPIKGIAYTDVPIARGKEDFVIEMRGNATILIKSDKLGVNKLITDVDLKKAIQKML